MEDNNKLIGKALDLIYDYYKREFGECWEYDPLISSKERKERDLRNFKQGLSGLGLAFTTYEEPAGFGNVHEIEVVADLISHSIITYIDGEIYDEWVYKNLEEMVEWGLNNLDFDALVSDGYAACDDLFDPELRANKEGF